MDAQALTDEIRAADREYQHRLGDAEAAKQRRDRAVLAATDAGLSRAQLAEVLGVNRARVQQIVARARRSPA